MANTGILLRRYSKAYFEIEENKPLIGEVVFALDTEELGMVDNSGNLIWSPLVGVVKSVAGKTGNVTLTRYDFSGLEKVDNTSDAEKPLSNAALLKWKTHLEAENPHNITKKTLNLENVDNTSDINKPISSKVASEFLKYISWETAKASTPDGVVKFTDTTYSIKDGELSEYNFNNFYKTFIDTFEHNARVLPAGKALVINGDFVGLNRADGSYEEVKLPDMRFDDSSLKLDIESLKQKLKNYQIIDALDSTSTTSALSANQGFILNNKIKTLNEMMKLDSNVFKNLKELADFVEKNRELLNSLSIDSIPGLRQLINSKADYFNDVTTVLNSAKLGNIDASEYALKSDVNTSISNINNSLQDLKNQINNFDSSEIVTQKINNLKTEIEASIKVVNDAIKELKSKIENLETDLNKKINDSKSLIDANTNSITNINSEIVEIKKSIKNNNIDLSAYVLKTDFETSQNAQNTKISTIEGKVADIETKITGFVSQAAIADMATRTWTNEQIKLNVEKNKSNNELAFDTETVQNPNNLDELHEMVEYYNDMIAFIKDTTGDTRLFNTSFVLDPNEGKEYYIKKIKLIAINKIDKKIFCSLSNEKESVKIKIVNNKFDFSIYNASEVDIYNEANKVPDILYNIVFRENNNINMVGEVFVEDEKLYSKTPEINKNFELEINSIWSIPSTIEKIKPHLNQAKTAYSEALKKVQYF